MHTNIEKTIQDSRDYMGRTQNRPENSSHQDCIEERERESVLNVSNEHEI